ncbi:PRTRC system protein B [Olivibacter sp. 47]|jgi:PRTRC genetic system protein B|uniref:PRTRC system protein B n=1 Tax=Olivibacter sp. 47 TaxID=3056486 RepID=UPI0025A4B332|nr:PRTRC system protein B [Olivibacter sp. 47]MDM8175947.1 PRTRC system protein B [Olivibacter sp. 47]
MKNISRILEDSYRPVKALVIFSKGRKWEEETYVESYDMDEQGMPINAHPLSEKECAKMACALSMDNRGRSCLTAKGLLPKNILHLSMTGSEGGSVVWFTPAQSRSLYFRRADIPDGVASVPPLVWKATTETLYLWALKSTAKLTVDTALYKAPFLNIYAGGNVCMGNVDIVAGKMGSLEEFITFWEQAFWNSAFSHTIDTNIVKDEDAELFWRQLIGTEKKFPVNRLVRLGRNLKSILK